MSLNGKNKHYDWHGIMPHHWFEQAKKINFPETDMQAIIDQTIGDVHSVIAGVSARLSGDYPSEISEPIFDSMKKALSKFNV